MSKCLPPSLPPKPGWAPEFWKLLQLWAARVWAEKSVRMGRVAVARGEVKGLACTWWVLNAHGGL